jgi:hypothetical protein
LQSDVGVPAGQQPPPLQPAAATASTASTVLLKHPPAEAMIQLRRTLRSPEPPPSGAYVNHFNSSGALGQRFDPIGSKSPRMTNKTSNILTIFKITKRYKILILKKFNQLLKKSASWKMERVICIRAFSVDRLNLLAPCWILIRKN